MVKTCVLLIAAARFLCLAELLVWSLKIKADEGTEITHSRSLTAVLDRLRVVVISTVSGPDVQADRHGWINRCLLPPAAGAKFSVDDRRTFPVNGGRCAREGING